MHLEIDTAYDLLTALEQQAQPLSFPRAPSMFAFEHATSSINHCLTQLENRARKQCTWAQDVVSTNRALCAEIIACDEGLGDYFDRS